MFDNMKFENISIMAAVMWEIVALAAFSILTLLALVILAPHTWLWYLVLFIIGLAAVTVVFLYVPFLYLNTEFAISKQAVVYRKGVIFPSTQVLYRDRIVFVTVYNNPLTPLLHVSTLVVSAAGGSLTIVFLNSKRAQELASQLAREKLRN